MTSPNAIPAIGLFSPSGSASDPELVVSGPLSNLEMPTIDNLPSLANDDSKSLGAGHPYVRVDHIHNHMGPSNAPVAPAREPSRSGPAAPSSRDPKHRVKDALEVNPRKVRAAELDDATYIRRKPSVGSLLSGATAVSSTSPSSGYAISGGG